jgi:hypothetical protein
MITILGPFVVLGLSVGLIAVLSHRRHGLARWRTATLMLATLRVGLFWLLLAFHWRGALGLWAIPLLSLFLPEGFLLPRDFTWTPTRAVLVTGLLVLGSALWAGLALVVVRGVRRRG